MARHHPIESIFDAAASRASLEFAVQPNSRTPSLTEDLYRNWQLAFDAFNKQLFGCALPDTVITFTRRQGVLGYFCAGSFRDQDGAVAHEIATNPCWLEARGVAVTLSTLVHEMCHLWRHLDGRPNRKGGKSAPGYHDAVWAEKMQAIGLMPSDTGKPGGRRTGFRMTHYAIEGGAFDRACRELLIAGHTIKWRDGRGSYRTRLVGPTPPASTSPTPAPAKNTRTRFICTGCDVKAWARASARLSCADCDLILAAR